MLPSFCKDTVTILRAELSGGVRQERDWAHPVQIVVDGCSVQESTTDGDVVSREDASLTKTVYFPPGTDLRHADRILWLGETYLMIGDVRNDRSPFGACDNVSATFKRWVG